MQILIRKLSLALISLLFLYAIITTLQLLFNPPIWPDEAYLADIASNILKNGNWGTNLWGTIIFGAQNHVYWYPPLYPLSLAAFFKVFGISISNQRIFSVLIGGAFLIVYYLLGSYVTANYKSGIRRLIIFSSILLLFIDNTFQRGAKFGRAEILALFFIMLGLYLFITVFNKTNPRKNLIYFLAGLSMGLASITHLLTSLFFVAIVSIILFQERLKIFKKNHNAYLFLGFIIPVIILICTIFPTYYPFLKQISLQRQYHEMVISHVQAIFKFESINEKLIYIIFIALTLISLGWSLIKKKLDHVLLSFVLMMSWVICIFGKLEWYSIYLLPFLYLLGTTICYELIHIKKSTQKIIGITILISFAYMAIVNINAYTQSYKKNNIHKQDYTNVGKEIINNIPPGKSIYLSSIPDFYFVLRDRYILYQFPPLPFEANDYFNLLNNTDYIVINVHFESMYVGDLLSKYIDINKSSEITIDKSALYKVQIFKLIPRNKRHRP